MLKVSVRLLLRLTGKKGVAVNIFSSLSYVIVSRSYYLQRVMLLFKTTGSTGEGSASLQAVNILWLSMKV